MGRAHGQASVPSFLLCQVFNALNSLELKSLEEPRYLLEQFGKNPLACLTLASFVAANTGDAARKWIKVRWLG
jgi:prolycopene isomerase